MTIYIDSCVLQDFKKDEYSEIVRQIESDKPKNIYCFSEAHLFDLARDETNEKYKDMKFMEEIVDNNCFFYNKKICFEYCTPEEYYNSFEWPNVKDFDSDGSLHSMFSNFKTIPLQLNQFLNEEDIPQDCPLEFIELLKGTSTMYDFMVGFLDFTEDMTNEQKKFKELIKYLHQNSLTCKIYESIGIKGFDGDKVIDMDTFRETFSAYYLKGKEKYRYDLFTDMYIGLEIFGFIKGKPKKQKLMNLINDARHAFFGGFCDIIVSKDEDFLCKTKFMYEVHGIKTQVLNVEQFVLHLTESLADVSNLSRILSELDNINQREILYTSENENKEYAVKSLDKTHYGYFDTVTFINDENGTHFYFSKEVNSFSTGTLVKQIDYVTHCLVSELGADKYHKEFFKADEIKEGLWEGRNWNFTTVHIDLNFTGKMYLRFIPLLSEYKSTS